LDGYEKPDDRSGGDGLLKRLKRLIERAFEAELTAERGTFATGYSGKTPKSGDGNLEIEVTQDRQGSLEPQLLPKDETRFGGTACPPAGRRPDPKTIPTEAARQ
jgi:putative transposase